MGAMRSGCFAARSAPAWKLETDRGAVSRAPESPSPGVSGCARGQGALGRGRSRLSLWARTAWATGMASSSRRRRPFIAKARHCRALAAVQEGMEAPPSTPEALRALRLRDLKQVMGAAGLDVVGCVDRESLLELLAKEGAVERVLASAAAAASRTKASIVEVPLTVGPPTSPYITIDLTLGPNDAQARFMVDTGAPFTCVANSSVMSLGGSLASRMATADWGERLPAGAQLLSLGSVKLGGLDCGELLVVPVEMPLPPGCCGLLSLDFLRRFDWEFDIPRKRARVCVTPAGCAVDPAMLGLQGLRRVPLETMRTTMAGSSMAIQFLSAPLQLVGMSAASEDVSSQCTAVLDLGSVTACSPGAVAPLSLTDADYTGAGKQLQGPSGAPQFVREAALMLKLGDGPDGPCEMFADVCVGHPALQKLGLTADTPFVILGLDVLGRSRIVFSPRTSSLWMSP